MDVRRLFAQHRPIQLQNDAKAKRNTNIRHLRFLFYTDFTLSTWRQWGTLVCRIVVVVFLSFYMCMQCAPYVIYNRTPSVKVIIFIRI